MTKKFEYTDNDGIKKEAETYTVSDFVTTSTPNSPAITLPSGKFDSSLIPAQAQAKAATLVVDRIATGTIFRGDVVRATTANHVSIGDSSLTLSDSTALGVALNNASDNDPVEVLILGIISDSIFNIFSVNSILFLDDAGGITDIKPTKPSRNYITVVGKCLGGGEVLVDIQQPITLGG